MLVHCKTLIWQFVICDGGFLGENYAVAIFSKEITDLVF
jgi:hypothetical protein